MTLDDIFWNSVTNGLTNSEKAISFVTENNNLKGKYVYVCEVMQHGKILEFLWSSSIILEGLYMDKGLKV